ncbi:MAG: SdpI family protein [Thermoanaerobaculaceae bacterium]
MPGNVAMSLPLVYGHVKPNPWFGFRLSQSFRSPEHWHRINRYGAILLIRRGLSWWFWDWCSPSPYP